MSGKRRLSGEWPAAEAVALRLQRRAALAGLDLPPPLAARLAAWLALLQRWNARLNLTALDASDHGLDRLAIEPLAAARHVSGDTPKLIDIGSGNGSPAIPLRLALGPGRLLMVESRQRKAAFLREAAVHLELAYTTVEATRFQTLAASPDLQSAFDLLTVRGVRLGRRELQHLTPLLAPGGRLLLFRSETSAPLPTDLPPALHRTADHPLLKTLASRLVVLQKGAAEL